MNKSALKTPFNVISRSITSWHKGLQYADVLESAKQRVMIVAIVLFLGFVIIALRLGDVMLFTESNDDSLKATEGFQILRRNIVDQNNEILATNIITASAYINPKQLLDPDDAAQKISSVLKNVSASELKKKFALEKNFVWLARHMPPKLQKDLNDLGLPGLHMYRDQTRVYPHSSLFSHITGMCGLDGDGLSGLEQLYDIDLQQGTDHLALSLDIRVQHILRTELKEGIKEFSALGGNAIVMKVKTGEILGMVSLPDFDPHKPNMKQTDAMFNKNTLGVYEPGSVFKVLNFAIGLETGKASLKTMYDGSQPIKMGKFTISDFRGLGRVMTLTEAFLKSSNIASVKMAQDFGLKTQKEYMKRFGVLDKVKLELPELGGPIIPRDWREPSLMSVSYGYGVSQTPLQILTAITSIINDGKKVKPTLLKKTNLMDEEEISVISSKTSRIIRKLMRQVVQEGTAKKVQVEGIPIFAKTGTVYKKQGKGYGKQQITTFVGGFPVEDPEIMMIVMLDDPKPTKESCGYAAAGWNVVQVAKRVIERVAPMYTMPNYVENAVVFAENKKDLSQMNTFKTSYTK